MFKNKHRGGFRKDQHSRSNFHHFGRQKRGRGHIRTRIDQSQYVRKAEDFIKIEETVPTNSFSDFGFKEELLANITAKGYVKPTEIQDKVIPHVTDNKDVLGLANTGTGKTAAYILPLLNKILNNPNQRIIILAPTRELAIQIKEEIRSFTMGMKVYVALAIGGAFIREQIINIRRGPHIIIGTPGRISDLGKRNVIEFEGLDTIVLDEVDRMLDMGFIGDVKAIVDQIPATRQTLFFSATIDSRVETLINSFLKDPVKISIKSQDASSHVEQNIVKVRRQEKERMLHKLLKNPEFKKVLVFGATQLIVENLTTSLAQNGFKAQGLHGGKKQYQRQQIVKGFRENSISILIATDVAARGLDIADITHVINYDEPNNYQDYIHRIGRTGRGNSKGQALTFVEERY